MTMLKAYQHSSRRHCIDERELVEGKTLRTFVQSMVRQSESNPQEIYVYKVRDKYSLEDDYVKRGFISPIYFGEGSEFLRCC